MFQTGDLRPYVLGIHSCTAVLLIACVWCLTNGRVLTRVSPYTVRSMAFLPLARLARTALPQRPVPYTPCGFDDEGNRLHSLHVWIAS